MDDRLSPRLMVNLHAGDNPRQPGRVDWAEADARWWRWNPNNHCKPTLTVDRGANSLIGTFSDNTVLGDNSTQRALFDLQQFAAGNGVTNKH